MGGFMYNNLNVMENIDSIINSFVNMYSQEYEIPENLKYKIQVVDSISEATSNFMKKTNRKYIVDETDYNGTTCIPNSIDDETEIYISRKLIEDYQSNNWQFICTVLHELTHAIDFYTYCNKYCYGDYDAMIKRNDYYGFKMWTEFNAKKISYLFYSRFIRKCMEESDLSIASPVYGEVEFQNDIITESIRNNYADNAVYDIVLYLGRYYCWEIDFSDSFVDEKLFPSVFKQELNPEISNLYDALKRANGSVMYYNEVSKLIRLLKGKLVMIEHEGGIL